MQWNPLDGIRRKKGRPCETWRRKKVFKFAVFDFILIVYFILFCDFRIILIKKKQKNKNENKNGF